ncbi:carbonic anhydrase, partial [Nonomuraea sp. NPDC001684]
HSGCGAMAALLKGPATTEGLPQLSRWLRHGHPSLDRLGEGGHDASAEDAALDALCRLNIQQQLENLRTYRKVDEQVRAGQLTLVGLYFEIGSARVHHVPPRASAAPEPDGPLPTEPTPT